MLPPQCCGNTCSRLVIRTGLQCEAGASEGGGLVLSFYSWLSLWAFRMCTRPLFLVYCRIVLLIVYAFLLHPFIYSPVFSTPLSLSRPLCFAKPEPRRAYQVSQSAGPKHRYPRQAAEKFRQGSSKYRKAESIEARRQDPRG
jgi:hypothetical protein